jgi:hypothetical protein
MTDSATQAPRIAQEFDLVAQQELLAILTAVDEYRDLIPPEDWSRAVTTARAVAERITERASTTAETRLACTLDEWIDLARVVECAWRHTNRLAGTTPLTGLHQIAGVTDNGFAALLRRCTASLHTPLPPTVVCVDDARRRHLAEALTFVKEIQHEIDPDMFRVGRDEFDACTALLVRAAQAQDVVIMPDELSRVETVVAAAWTYSYRGKGSGLTHVKDPEFDALTRWLGESHQAMLRAAGLPTLMRVASGAR